MSLIQNICFRRNVLDKLHGMDMIGGPDPADAAFLEQPILEVCNTPFEPADDGYVYVPLRPLIHNVEVLLIFHVQIDGDLATVFEVENVE